MRLPMLGLGRAGLLCGVVSVKTETGVAGAETGTFPRRRNWRLVGGVSGEAEASIMR